MTTHLKLIPAFLVAALVTTSSWAAGGERVSKIMGEQVVDSKGVPIALVYDVVVPEAGSAPYVVLNKSTDPENINTLAAVPYAALKRSDGGLTLAGVTMGQFEDAPTFAPDDWPDMTDTQWRAEIDNFYGVGLTRSEIAERSKGDEGAIEPTFSSLDENGDGKLSREEVASVEAVSQSFDAADVNQDGNIDESEFSAFEFRTGVMPGPIGIEGETDGESEEAE